MKTPAKLAMGAGLAALVAAPSFATELVGEVQFDEEHAFTKALREFDRVAGECSGGSLTFDLPLNDFLRWGRATRDAVMIDRAFRSMTSR